MADPLAVPLSRLFVVCGRAVEVRRGGGRGGRPRGGPPGVRSQPSPRPCPQEETLRGAFDEYGAVQHVKLIKDKGGEAGRRRLGAHGGGAAPWWRAAGCRARQGAGVWPASPIRRGSAPCEAALPAGRPDLGLHPPGRRPGGAVGAATRPNGTAFHPPSRLRQVRQGLVGGARDGDAQRRGAERRPRPQAQGPAGGGAHAAVSAAARACVWEGPLRSRRRAGPRGQNGGRQIGRARSGARARVRGGRRRPRVRARAREG